MRPIRTAASNTTFTGPRPEIADLPCRIENEGGLPVTRSVHKLTPEEREAIAAGANIELSVYMAGHPPVSLTVIEAEESPNDDDLRCVDCDGLYTEGRGLGECGFCGGELVPAAERPEDA